MQRSRQALNPLRLNRRTALVIDQTEIEEEIDALRERDQELAARDEELQADIDAIGWSNLPERPLWTDKFDFVDVGAALLPPEDTNFDIVAENSITPSAPFTYNIGQHLLRWRHLYAQTARLTDGVLFRDDLSVVLFSPGPGVLELSNADLRGGGATLSSLAVSGPLSVGGAADMNGQRIQNLADPVDPLDAVNLGFLEGFDVDWGKLVNRPAWTDAFSSVPEGVASGANLVPVIGVQDLGAETRAWRRGFFAETVVIGGVGVTKLDDGLAAGATVLPGLSNAYDLGLIDQPWRKGYFADVYVGNTFPSLIGTLSDVYAKLDDLEQRMQAQEAGAFGGGGGGGGDGGGGGLFG